MVQQLLNISNRKGGPVQSDSLRGRIYEWLQYSLLFLGGGLLPPNPESFINEDHRNPPSLDNLFITRVSISNESWMFFSSAAFIFDNAPIHRRDHASNLNPGHLIPY